MYIYRHFTPILYKLYMSVHECTVHNVSNELTVPYALIRGRIHMDREIGIYNAVYMCKCDSSARLIVGPSEIRCFPTYMCIYMYKVKQMKQMEALKGKSAGKLELP